MDYKETLNLPKTNFSMKANLSSKEPELVRHWDEIALYSKILKKNAQKPKFIHHDGPPYANGDIHDGHVLNKVLKDIIVKYKNMNGFLCSYIPGWDCHGLPIEQKVGEELGDSRYSKPPLEIRALCRDFALKYVNIQRNSFKRLGILGDWNKPYLTIDREYEATIIKEIGKFFNNGYVYKGKKPVHWCYEDRTALAEAEVEYETDQSPSIYVKFPLKESEKLGLGTEKPISVLIWTTTPWTLPSNLAICLHPDFEYAAVEMGSDVILVAKEMVGYVAEQLHVSEYKVLKTFPAKLLERMNARNLLMDRDSLIILGSHVTTGSGTGCVHTAPGHGREDYIVGLEYGLDIFAPVDEKGVFTKEAGKYAGMFVFDANDLIVKDLVGLAILMNDPKDRISHEYPHCWRCKKPIIFRATEQWFINVDHHDLRAKTLDAIDRVNWIPTWGRDRIYGMIQSRPDWCISRQRTWGVPIPVIYCGQCGQVIMNEAFIEHISAKFLEEGSDYWFKHQAAELLPPGMGCPTCGPSHLKKENNILDVWFESGVSFAAVIERTETPETVTDLYLEGSDQHRGWFHSAILASMGTRGRAPYKSVLTHGFVVDARGKKISKSNPPSDYIPTEITVNQKGAEILRLWTAAEDYRQDIRISKEILDRLVEAYRKIRNTMRFIIGNLFDYDPKRNEVPYEKLSKLDQYVLHKLQLFIERMVRAYDEYQFHMVYHSLLDFCTVDMSAFYLDILKTRLYTLDKDDISRRAAQTTLFELIVTLCQLMAPVLSFTSDEIWLHVRRGDFPESVFLTDFPAVNPHKINKTLEAELDRVFEIREMVLKKAEDARVNKIIGKSLDGRVTIACPEKTYQLLKEYEGMLADIFIASQVELTQTGEKEVRIEVSKALGEKCERCWQYSTEVAENSHRLCPNCETLLQKQNFFQMGDKGIP